LSSISDENPQQFENRKADHIRLALDPQSQTDGASGLDRLRLQHEAFPEIDFDHVDPSVRVFGESSATPMFVSSMTAGHSGSGQLNLVMARVCEKRNWLMGVGSQRKQLSDRGADREWVEIRKQCPHVRFFGNIGVSQVVKASTDQIRRLVDSLNAVAMIVHTNPLQECLQPEGTPQFSGGLRALERLCRELDVPVIVKETGCGFSRATLNRLRGLGVAAVDISGMGGTHWGRIEGGRSQPGTPLYETARTFRDWGIGTLESLLQALDVAPDYEVWASGGVRSGLDAAKLAAVGARMVGLAKPVIEAAVAGEEELDRRLWTFEYEFKTALFCTGSRTVSELREKQKWDLLK
jgi:isopentenyl-diphosphate delta-isomerase